MKWVQISPGRYKLVNDNDERPAIKLKAKNGSPNVKFTPSWKKYEQNYWTPDPEFKASNDLTDKFIAEREHAIKTDPKSKRWEDGRKREWARNKPAWIKENQNKWD